MRKVFFALFFIVPLMLPSQTIWAYTSTFGTIGWHAYSIVLDSAGNIYSANFTDSNVSKVTQAGVSTIFATTGTNPFAITIDAAGNLYTANNGSNNVSKITPEGVSTVLGTTGTNPSGIVLDGAGNVYTSNNGSNNVSKITPGGVSTILGTTGSNPSGITIDNAGNIYTANTWSDNVSKITPEGVSTILGTTGTNPSGIVLDNAGNVYTTNSSSNNVSKITPGGVSTILASVVSGPAGIVIDGSGNLYVANNYLANSVSKITPAGVSAVVGYTDYAPNGIAIDDDGNVYTANYASNSRNITKFSNPTIAEITPVPNLTLSDTITYVFSSNSAGTISYGGSCDSDTVSATVGTNSVVFNPLPVGTYNNCTVLVTDLFGLSNMLSIPSFIIEASQDATITSNVYTVSGVGGGQETIDGVVYSTAKADFLNNLEANQVGQVWNNTGVNDPVVAGDTLIVTAEDGITLITYTVGSIDIPEYTLTYIAGQNGSITGDTSQTVLDTQDGTQVTAVPDSGYHFTSWSDGVLTAARTDTNVTDNITVTASFAFTTVIPTLTTSSATSLTQTAATLSGNITNTGGENATVQGFEYGLTASYGSSVSGNGSYGTGSFGIQITGLTCGTTYHYRAYATNTAGSGFGADTTFTTSNCAVQGGGSSGGGGRSSKPKTNTEIICPVGYLFSTLTGKPCTSFVSNTSNTSNTSLFPIFSPISPSTCVIIQTLRLGSRGDQVKCLQTKLNILSDGIFGPKTRASVIFFQQSHNLTPDGVVGPLTRAVLGN